MPDDLCYCGSSKTFKLCCQVFIEQLSKPQSAEQLMRSRYSAFCIKQIDYLINTLAPNKRLVNERLLLQQSIEQTEWLGLQIIQSNKGNQNDQTGQVEFIAFYSANDGGVSQIHELSNFYQKNGQWFYLDGLHLPPIKLSRNDTCFCGSSKKYKKCHGL